MQWRLQIKMFVSKNIINEKNQYRHLFEVLLQWIIHMDVNLRKSQNLSCLMVAYIKSIFYFKHTILKLCWANSHKVMSMILTNRYSPFAYFSTNLELKRQESISVHIITFITFSINEMFNPFTPMSDQGRISLYSINRISSRLMIRIKKNIS